MQYADLAKAMASGFLSLTAMKGVVDLTRKVSGVLPVANGGIGSGAALVAGQVMVAGTTSIAGAAYLFWDSANQRLGVGTASPSKTLHVVGDFLVDGGGTYTGPGAAGAKILLIGAKYAFRAGRLISTEWDDANVGYYSTAIGHNVRATANNSVSIGYNSYVENGGVCAIGTNNKVNKNLTVAIGVANTACGAYSAVYGRFNTVGSLTDATDDSPYAFILGYGNQIISNSAYNCILGIESYIEASSYCCILGSSSYFSNCSASNGVGVGNTVSGSNSNVLGSYNTISGAYCSGIGPNLELTGAGSIGISSYPHSTSKAKVSGSNSLGVFLGNRSGDNLAQSNAVAIMGADVGIGTLAPTSKLQVVGLPVYASNAAAVTGGLSAGAFYRTNSDPDTVCVVH